MCISAGVVVVMMCTSAGVGLIFGPASAISGAIADLIGQYNLSVSST